MTATKGPALVPSHRQGPVLTLTLHDPATRNAFSLEMATDLLAKVKGVLHDQEIRCIILTGTPPAFSAGGNIKLMASSHQRGIFFLKISKVLHEVALLFRQTSKIVIAAVNGPVSGVAFGLILSADLRYALPQATFHAGTTLLGLAPNGSITYFLPRLIGMARATELLLTGKKVTAREAETLGLIHQVLPARSFLKDVHQKALELAAKAPLAQAKIKSLLATTWDYSPAQQMEAERQAIAWTSETKDFAEGLRAFLEKRTPQFSGK